MIDYSDWRHDEFKQVGRDYGSADEVTIYDQTHAKFRDVEKEYNELLDRLAVSSGQSLIDFGCGTGVFAIQASLRGVNVYAVDISNAMLSYARSRATESAAHSVTFINSGFLNYSPLAGPVDFITTSFSFHHLPDFWKGIALKRMHSMLGENGILYIQDIVISEENCVENIHSFIKAQEALGGEFLKVDAIEHFRDEYSTYDWVLEGLLERSGFTINSKESFVGLIGRYMCKKMRT